jgi:hypothetical protein
MRTHGVTRTPIEAMAVIDAALAGVNGVTVQQLCGVLRCQPRQVRRYLDWMRQTFRVDVRLLGTDRYVYAIGEPGIFTSKARRAFT